MAARPSTTELAQLIDLGTLLEWAGLNNDDEAEATDAVAAVWGLARSFLAFYGTGPMAHFRQFAAMEHEMSQNQEKLRVLLREVRGFVTAP